MSPRKPHVLGIDDGPFEKGQGGPVPIVGVMMECPQRLECVAIGAFEVDGDGVTDYLGDWIRALRCYPTVQAVMLGGITLAGLALVDVARLAEQLERPVLVVNRRDPRNSRLAEALRSAGLESRLALLETTPPALRMADGLFVSWAGIQRGEVESLVRLALGKAQVPEPIRAAHMIARALVRGESRGRV